MQTVLNPPHDGQGPRAESSCADARGIPQLSQTDPLSLALLDGSAALAHLARAYAEAQRPELLQALVDVNNALETARRLRDRERS